MPIKKEDIKVLHYIMTSKPWHYKNCRFASYFWKYANQTSVLELILQDLNAYTEENKINDIKSCEKLAETAKKEANREDTYFKIINKDKAPDRLKIMEKIVQYEKEGRFDEDVEQDPPTKELYPEKVDYLRKKLKSKIKTKIAFSVARIYLNHMLENQKMIVKEIIGLEHFQNLKSGAVITCNHFNALDSFAIQMAYEQSHHKDRKFYRVIREGNFTSFPGFYGFLMRNCNTLPLSSNMQTMKKFIKSTNQLLKDGNFVLFYPEQSMWWNYRKPKPLKEGAYKFAAKNMVPVLPCFITMEDSDIIGNDGFYIQKYTIHIEKPIYPEDNKSISENVSMMKNKNYDLWKNIYEENYNTPLIYYCKHELVK